MSELGIEEEGAVCNRCGEPAKYRTCETCGESAWIIDCGHYAQPRPLAADEYGHIVCNDCYEERRDRRNTLCLCVVEEGRAKVITETQNDGRFAIPQVDGEHSIIVAAHSRNEALRIAKMYDAGELQADDITIDGHTYSAVFLIGDE